MTDKQWDDIAVELETVMILVTSAYKEGWSDGSVGIEMNEAWEKSLTRTTIAELKGEADD